MGPPTEALLKAITGKEFAIGESETRLVEVGESARISEEVGITPHFFYGAVITSFSQHSIRFIASISFNRPSDCACVERTSCSLFLRLRSEAPEHS